MADSYCHLVTEISAMHICTALADILFMSVSAFLCTPRVWPANQTGHIVTVTTAGLYAYEKCTKSTRFEH